MASSSTAAALFWMNSNRGAGLRGPLADCLIPTRSAVGAERWW
jgi:hypothetical protein